MPASKCPVCDWDIPTNSARTVRAGDRTITVCCDECAQAVEKAPEAYAR